MVPPGARSIRAVEVSLHRIYVDHVTDEEGQVTEVHVEYHPNSKSGSDTSGHQGQGHLALVGVRTKTQDAEVWLYERLFLDESPDGHKDRLHGLPESRFVGSPGWLQS